MYQQRTYRTRTISDRFRFFTVQYLETDLWVGVDKESYAVTMPEVVYKQVVKLRQEFNDYYRTDPDFFTSLKPVIPVKAASNYFSRMCKASLQTGVGPMAGIAGLFAEETGKQLLEKFSIGELVIENGGDCFISVQEPLVVHIFAGESPLSEKVGIIIQKGSSSLGICTSSGRVGFSKSFGKADAVMVVSPDTVLADQYATAICNQIQSREDIEKELDIFKQNDELYAVAIIMGDKIGYRGDFEMDLIS